MKGEEYDKIDGKKKCKLRNKNLWGIKNDRSPLTLADPLVN